MASGFSEEDLEDELSRMSVEDEESLLETSTSLRQHAAAANLEAGLDSTLKKEQALKLELEATLEANTAVLNEYERVEAHNRDMEAKIKALEEEIKYLDDCSESCEKQFELQKASLSLTEQHLQHLRLKLQCEEQKSADLQKQCDDIVAQYQNVYDELCNCDSSVGLCEENRPAARSTPRSEKRSADNEAKVDTEAVIRATIVEMAKIYVNSLMKPAAMSTIERSSDGDVVMESQIAPTPGTALVFQLNDLQLTSQVSHPTSLIVQVKYKETDETEKNIPGNFFQDNNKETDETERIITPGNFFQDNNKETDETERINTPGNFFQDNNKETDETERINTPGNFFQDNNKETDEAETCTPFVSNKFAEDFLKPDNPQRDFVPNFFGSADCQSQFSVQSSAPNKDVFSEEFTFEF